MRVKLFFKKIISLTLIIVFSINLFPIKVLAVEKDFSDVKNNHWAYEYINKLKELNITSGIGDNKFGMGNNITRAEFVTFLDKMMNSELVEDIENNFSDNEKDAWYHNYINTALKHNVIYKDDKFRPNEDITREDMAIMIINSLGYNNLANTLNNTKSYFIDVNKNIGFINMAKDFGFINGVDENNYKPNNNAKREEVAAILVRMYDRISNNIEYKNAFYAIKSANQKDSIEHFNSISFGWARLDFKDGELIVNNTSLNNNEYILPEGYEEIIDLSKDKDKLLMFAVTDDNAKKILNDSLFRNKAVNLMVEHSKNYDGVVIDFEGLKGEELKLNLNRLLKDLRGKLGNKKIFVAVHPILKGNQDYFDGYDYRTIGEIADKVILMAHDYNAKSLTKDDMENNRVETPLASIEDVYYGLKAITDSKTGVSDSSKILLQLSFGIAQWKSVDGKVINENPYTPDYKALISRMESGADIKYSKKYESPYIKFYNSEDNTDNIAWYEDTRSIDAKINLAKLFNIKGISIWRLGIVPDENSKYYMDILDKIEKY